MLFLCVHKQKDYLYTYVCSVIYPFFRGKGRDFVPGGFCSGDYVLDSPELANNRPPRDVLN